MSQLTLLLFVNSRPFFNILVFRMQPRNFYGKQVYKLRLSQIMIVMRAVLAIMIMSIFHPLKEVCVNQIAAEMKSPMALMANHLHVLLLRIKLMQILK